jgi:hypothetical protein
LDSNPSANPIDLFIASKLHALGLSFSPEASRQTLIRRVYFDLIGLPPVPEEVDRFVADPDPLAYEHLIDRLLDSPQYGERWARHWLDVVHYGDTHGYDKDQPRPNAWPYRDYVIRAFNEDKPYSRFVQEQVAGDILFPYTRDGIEALGFISAGPWDLIGHAELPESKMDGRIARHLDRDDMVSNTINTFNSMTVQCAQCHNHKFDPISSEDYYSLQAVFAAVDRTNREYYDDPLLNKKREELRENERELGRRKKELQEQIERVAGPEYAELQKKLASAKSSKNESRPPEYGYHSAIESGANSLKWVQVDLGRPIAIARIVLYPAWDDFAGIGAGFGFPRRFKIEVSSDPEFNQGVQLLYESGSDQPNPGIRPQTFSTAGATARYVRVTATRLAPRQNDYIFALAELEVLDVGGKNFARGAIISAMDSIEAEPRWAKKNLVDGIRPNVVNSEAIDVAAMQKSLAELLEQSVDEPTRVNWRETTNRLARTEADLAEMPKPKLAYVGGVHYGSGAFRGTGPEGGKPRPIHVLARGDLRNQGKEVGPGALSAITSLPARFDLPPSAGEGERRKALALWLTDPRHPLTWRSIVNRVWQYHFGRGLVETPDDFGRMGALPSHPELLDWLAVEFRDSGRSFKKLHKLIMTSAAYRQVSSIAPASSPRDGERAGVRGQRANEIDHDNRLLWRMNRRKLEAEAVRDSVLLVSGCFDKKMFGPAFQDFVIEKPEHSPHYEYDKFDPDDPRGHRRSIYRFIVRSQQEPFMTTLDCADPSMHVPKRNESVSALQALALLNNPFMLTMAKHFAEKTAAHEPTLAGEVRRSFSTALSRQPTAQEQSELVEFARGNGLANTCRLLFNLNEFNFAD